MTYRYRGHSMADPELYRTKAEVEQFRSRDAIERLKRHLMDAGRLDDSAYAALEARVEAEVEDAVQFADASPQPDISTLTRFITKEPANG
jgi:pyruvate dehydrogenase E1 component alpha subunit